MNDLARYLVFAYEEGNALGGCMDMVMAFGTFDEYHDAWDGYQDALDARIVTDFQVYDTKVRDLIFSDKKKHQYDDVEGRVFDYLEELSLSLLDD